MRIVLLVPLGVVLVGLPVAAFGEYPGDPLPYILFELSFTGMLLLALPRPRRYGYTFFATLLFLGFWAKFNLHTLRDYSYQEPIGLFDASGESWDEALLVASCGAIGLSAARVVQLILARGRRSASRAPAATNDGPPQWFVAQRRRIWLLTAAAMVVVFTVNAAGAIYHVGVDDRLDLPLHGNLVIGWLVKAGLALWIATLVYWEERLGEAPMDRVLLAPVGEAATAAVSALSRGIFLVHALPYALVVAERWRHFRRALGVRRLATIAAVTVVGFVSSLAAVSLLRLVEYPDDVPEQAREARAHASLRMAGAPAGDVTSDELSFAVREVRSLFVERWTGLEGVLAVSSHDGLGRELFGDAVTEDPARGEDALYQRLSGRSYVSRADYTFLTLPGPIAVLYYSGSLLFVLLGMATLTFVMLGIEGLLGRFSGNPYLAAVAGFTIAFELSQANFPYLLGVFFVLVTLSLAAIAALTRARSSHA